MIVNIFGNQEVKYMNRGVILPTMKKALSFCTSPTARDHCDHQLDLWHCKKVQTACFSAVTREKIGHCRGAKAVIFPSWRLIWSIWNSPLFIPVALQCYWWPRKGSNLWMKTAFPSLLCVCVRWLCSVLSWVHLKCEISCHIFNPHTSPFHQCRATVSLQLRLIASLSLKLNNNND